MFAILAEIQCLWPGRFALAGIIAEFSTFTASRYDTLLDAKYLVIVNKGRTRMEGMADLVFHDSIGRILSAVGPD